VDTFARSRALDRVGEQSEEIVISTEVGEVLECEVDGTDERAGGAQLAQFVALSLAAGHAMTLRLRADRLLSRG
jgi:hypothetical protein